MLTPNSSALEHTLVGLIPGAGRAGPGGLPGAAEPALAMGLTACAGQEQQLGLEEVLEALARGGRERGPGVQIGSPEAAQHGLSTCLCRSCFQQPSHKGWELPA